VRVDEDRRRAEKFKAKRARKAEKRPSGKDEQRRGGATADFVRPEPAEADEDAA